MTFVRCNKCYKEFKKPCQLERHNQRKTPCNKSKFNIDNKSEDSEIKEDILDEYIPIKIDNTLNSDENIIILFRLLNELKKDNEILKKDNEFLKKDNEILKINNKELINNNNKIDLMLKNNKKDNEVLNKELLIIKNNFEKIDIITKNSSQIINNYSEGCVVNNNTNIYNINITNYGNEKYEEVINLEKLNDDSYEKNGGKIIQKIFSQIHLNIIPSKIYFWTNLI